MQAPQEGHLGRLESLGFVLSRQSEMIEVLHELLRRPVDDWPQGCQYGAGSELPRS